jgi:hypothetical protein
MLTPEDRLAIDDEPGASLERLNNNALERGDMVALDPRATQLVD